MKQETPALVQEELEVLIPAIESPAAAQKVAKLLREIPGLDAIGISSKRVWLQHVWLTFRPSETSRQAIYDFLTRNNFPPAETLENGRWVTC
ncbi:MAG: hypothetical protein ABI443_03905 [Chthoniobacterales bacterium]